MLCRPVRWTFVKECGPPETNPRVGFNIGSHPGLSTFALRVCVLCCNAFAVLRLVFDAVGFLCIVSFRDVQSSFACCSAMCCRLCSLAFAALSFSWCLRVRTFGFAHTRTHTHTKQEMWCLTVRYPSSGMQATRSWATISGRSPSTCGLMVCVLLCGVCLCVCGLFRNVLV